MGCNPEGTVVVARGSWGTVQIARCRNGLAPARSFLDALSDEEYSKFLALFERMAEVGRIENKERFGPEGDKTYAFKTKRYRVACFQQGNTWYLTNGFKKQRRPWRRQDKDRASRIRDEHLGGA